MSSLIICTLIIYIYVLYKFGAFKPKYWLSFENVIGCTLMFSLFILDFFWEHDFEEKIPFFILIFSIFAVIIYCSTLYIVRKVKPLIKCPNCGFFKNYNISKELICPNCGNCISDFKKYQIKGCFIP